MIIIDQQEVVLDKMCAMGTSPLSCMSLSAIFDNFTYIKERITVSMDKHHGKILEYTLRKNDYNISDLAKSMNVNRRTLYNWFSHEKIKKDIVFRIGCIIRHDFSTQFPEMFTSEDFSIINMPKRKQLVSNEGNVWKNKYMSLLHEYNKIANRHLKII